MQTQTIYVRAGSVLATWVDSANQTSSAPFPTLARGQKAELVIGFFKDENADSIMTQAEVQQYVAWDFAYDSDYSTQTTPKIRTTEGFTVDEGGYLHIPIDTGTEELRTAIGTSESITLSAELDGYLAGEPDSPALIIQWNGQPFRNRIIEGGTGTPVPVDDGQYTKAQVNALVSGEIVYQFSADGVSWHDTQAETDVWFRSRNSVLETVAWSAAMKLPAGVEGKPGEPGKPGADGFSPSAKVEQAGGTTTITITDKDGTTTATIQSSGGGGGGGGGTVDAYTKSETDALLANYALKADAATDHNHDSKYLKLAGGTLTGSLTAPSISVTGSITEGGTALSSKYAAKSHSHSMSDVTGLQSALNGKAATSHTHAVSDVNGLQNALDGKASSTHTHAMTDVTGLQDALNAKADADAVPSSCVAYAETLPTPSDGAPGCVIVTGATSETQTKGHVYSLLRHEQSITKDLNVSFSYNTFAAGKFRVYGSGSCHANGGNLYEYDLAWISSTADSGTNVGEVILFKRKGSDTRWYLHGNNSDYVWRCADDSCLNISDPLGLSGMTFSNPESAMTTITITDAGTVSPTIDFTCRGETTNLYRVEDSNGKPQWRGKVTQGGMAIVSLSWSTSGRWVFDNNRELNPTSVYITSTANSPLDESGKEWTVYEEYSGEIGTFPVTITERPLPPEVSWSYEDITVQELESLRSSLTALEARVAALEAPSA